MRRLLILFVFAIAFTACGGRSSDGPFPQGFGLDAVCVGTGAATPFLVAPSNVILEAGWELSEYRLISTSPTGDGVAEAFLVDPNLVGAGDVYSPEADVYDSIDFLRLPGEGSEPITGPGEWTLVLQLTDTVNEQTLRLEGIEYTIDGTKYFVEDTLELTLTASC